MSYFLAFLALPLALVAMFLSVVFSLGGMTRAVFQRRGTPRFQAVDLFSLTIVAAVVFSIASRLGERGMGNVLVSSCVVTVVIGVVAWWMLSCARVGNPRKRFVFFLHLPGAMAVASVWVVLANYVVATNIQFGTSRRMIGLVLVVAPLNLLAMTLLRYASDWIAAVDDDTEVTLPTRVSSSQFASRHDQDAVTNTITPAGRGRGEMTNETRHP